MAWAEKTTFDQTIHKVPAPADESGRDKEEEKKLRKVFKDMPPFIKMTSKRALRTLAKYEELKQRNIERLRENCVFKFVMLVAGLTNERMETYWKGDSVDPFSDKLVPMTTKMDTKDLKMLRERAREKAFAELHYFCGPVRAIPMYRRARRRNEREIVISPPSAPQRIASGTTEADVLSSASTAKEVKRQDYSDAELETDTEETNEDGGRSNTENLRNIAGSKVKYIYNMSDQEFENFINRFQKDKDSVDNMRWYVLGRDIGGRNHPEDNGESPFPAHRHFRGQDSTDRRKTFGQKQSDEAYPWYDPVTGVGEMPRSERGYPNNPATTAQQGRHGINHSRDRIFDYQRMFDINGNQIDSYDHPDEYLTLKRSNWWQWAQNVPIVRWDQDIDKGRPEYWFQRYIARWLTRDSVTRTANNRAMIGTNIRKYKDLELFRNRYQGVFNNLYYDKNIKAWIRNLTGLRLTKMIKKAEDTEGGFRAEDWEGEDDLRRPCDLPCEVPLDFVRPLYYERFSHWKHELVLGEYEKRIMYQADQWLQRTPWAIGKIYLQPSIYAHMQEAHIAISSKFKKFASVNLADWLSTEEHRYFFSKLVALCIRTSAVLSNKRYGLDKAYMRLNLEKKRIMYAIGKLDPPRRVRTGGSTPIRFERGTPREIDAWERYRDARKRRDPTAAANALNDMNKAFRN